MRIVEEDLVDWEPLRMRFIFQKRVGASRHKTLVAFIDEWFATKAALWPAEREAGARPQPSVEYLGASVVGQTAVETFANRMPAEWLQELADAVCSSFPDVDHLRLGLPLVGPTERSGFKWMHVAKVEVTLHGRSITVGDVDVSLHHVSVGQFEEFMSETGYRPTRDRLEGDGSLLSWLRINFGRSPKVPAFGVSYDDAAAYCGWAALRLPSEAELYAFFLSLARDNRRVEWGGECWTSDAGRDGTFVACDGPYAPALRTSPPSLENRSNCYANDHYDYPFISFRVAKS